MLQTRKSNPNKPVRIMAYGVEGVGKSTLGAKSDKPIFISPEGGTDQLTDSQGNPVEEMAGVRTWDGMKAALKSLLTEKHDFKTLVIDSADWVEKLAHVHIVGNSGKTITTCNGGYGSGYRQSELMHKELIEDLSQLREKVGMNIIVTAHAHVRAVKDPSMAEDYDSFEIKCHELVSSLWREWVDGLFFVRFRTFLKIDEKEKARALSDGTRVAYTVKQPSFQAKNRYGLPPEMDFTEGFWDFFIKLSKKIVVTDVMELKTEIAELSLLVDPLVLSAVKEAVEKAGEDGQQLLKIKFRLQQLKGKVA